MDGQALTPIGYRFHPNDEELVGHYLTQKLLGNSTVHDVIAEIDVCQFEPWKLPAFSKVKSDDQEWFFFSPVGKLPNDTRNRCNRKTEGGFWKPTGKDREIKARGTNDAIGTKKILVFYWGRSSGAVKTNWVIHEYHADKFLDKRGFVLCRLINKDEKAERETDTLIHDEGQPSSHIAADFENQEIVDNNQSVHALPEVSLESIFPSPPQAEEFDFPSLQESTIGIEQESSSWRSILCELETNADIPSIFNKYFPSDDVTDQHLTEVKDERGVQKLGLEGSCHDIEAYAVQSTTLVRPVECQCGQLSVENQMMAIQIGHRNEVNRLFSCVSELVKEVAATKDEANDLERNLAYVHGQLKNVLEDVEKLTAMKRILKGKNKSLLERITKLESDLESERALRTIQVEAIQVTAFQDHQRGFYSALAQVRLIYPNIDLSWLGSF